MDAHTARSTPVASSRRDAIREQLVAERERMISLMNPYRPEHSSTHPTHSERRMSGCQTTDADAADGDESAIAREVVAMRDEIERLNRLLHREELSDISLAPSFRANAGSTPHPGMPERHRGGGASAGGGDAEPSVSSVSVAADTHVGSDSDSDDEVPSKLGRLDANDCPKLPASAALWDEYVRDLQDCLDGASLAEACFPEDYSSKHLKLYRKAVGMKQAQARVRVVLKRACAVHPGMWERVTSGSNKTTCDAILLEMHKYLSQYGIDNSDTVSEAYMSDPFPSKGSLLQQAREFQTRHQRFVKTLAAFGMPEPEPRQLLTLRRKLRSRQDLYDFAFERIKTLAGFWDELISRAKVIDRQPGPSKPALAAGYVPFYTSCPRIGTPGKYTRPGKPDVTYKYHCKEHGANNSHGDAKCYKQHPELRRDGTSHNNARRAKSNKLQQKVDKLERALVTLTQAVEATPNKKARSRTRKNSAGDEVPY